MRTIPTRPAMNVAVIINSNIPRRKQRAIIQEVRSAFPENNLTCNRTRFRGHAVALASSAARSGADIVIAAGGDGTINEVMNGILGSRTTLGIIPAGTANDFAAFHGIGTDVREAARLLRRQASVPIDVIRVNGWHYFTAGGIGLAAAVAHAANRLKEHFVGRILARGILRSALYPLAVVVAFCGKRDLHCPITIRSAGKLFTADAFTLLASNQSFLGGHFHVSPGADARDGWIDVCLIRNARTRLATLEVVAATMRGGHLSSRHVEVWRTQDLHITSERPLLYFGDGEVLDAAKTFDISVIHGALPVIVPEVSRTGRRAHPVPEPAESLNVAA